MMNRRKEWLLHALCFFKWGPFGMGDHSKCPYCARLWEESMQRIRRLKDVKPPQKTP